MIPVHLNEQGRAKGPDQTHYIVASNGLFLCKKMAWVDAVVPVGKIRTLQAETPRATLTLPKLPSEILGQSLKLAKVVYDRMGGEVCLLLHYNPTDGYSLTVPKQFVSGVSVVYDTTQREHKTIQVGTIHSHGHFRAFHSETDHQDESDTDGVHITLGNIPGYPSFTLSAEIAINGMRFPVEQTWFDGLQSGPAGHQISWPNLATWTPPADWVDAVLLLTSTPRTPWSK